MKLSFSHTSLVVLPLLITSAARAQEITPTALPTPETATSSTRSEESSSETAATEDKEDVVVVTATRTRQTLAETTSAVTVVTRAQIEAKKPVDLVEAIRLAPGVSVAQSGTRGKNTSIFLRGTNSNQTLVLLDGVRANSPADGRFDFGLVPVENIERIEIVRGPQSALYGSDALGGVINIITLRGRGENVSGGRLEFGSQNTNKQVFNFRGEDLSLSFSRDASQGFFANDDYKNAGVALRFDRDLNPDSTLTFTLRGNDSEVGTPGQREFSFDPDARSRSRDFASGVQWNNKSGKRRDRVILGIADRRLRFEDKVNEGVPFSSFTDSTNRSRVLDLDAQSSFDLGAHKVTVGGELRRENAVLDSDSTFGVSQFSEKTTTRALFVQNEYRRGALTLVPGIRYENNSQFGGNLSGRLAAGYELNDKLRLKGSLGTGFKAPSFNDLYFPNYGNVNLEPEKSVGADIGFEYSTSRDGLLNVSVFQNKLRNLITGVFVPPFSFQAQNVNRATTKGLEISLDQPLNDDWRFVLNQTFLRTSSSGQPLLRRPKFNTTADLIYRKNRVRAGLGMVAQGERFDISPSYSVEKFGGFARFDLSLGYTLKSNHEIYARLGNLTNKRYDEAAGFPAPRFNFVIGLQRGAF